MKKTEKKATVAARSAVAFMKGRNAYNANRTLNDNPFSTGSPSAYAWMKGWLEGMKQHH